MWSCWKGRNTPVFSAIFLFYCYFQSSKQTAKTRKKSVGQFLFIRFLGPQWRREEEVRSGAFEGDSASCFFFICSFVHFLFSFVSKNGFTFFQVYFIASKSIKVKLFVSSAVGPPWSCGVLTTKGGLAGIGLSHLLGRDHDSTSQSGVEAPCLLKRSLTRLDCCVVVAFVRFFQSP